MRLVAALVVLLGCAKHRRAHDAPSPEPPAVVAVDAPPPPCLSLAECRAECQRGTTHGCVLEATFLAFGWGVPKNPTRSDQLLREACDHYDADGCRTLVELHLDGSAPPDADQLMARAATLYRTSCDRARAEACVQLGELSEFKAAHLSPAESLALFTKACRLGNIDGCHQQAVLTESIPSELLKRMEELARAGCDRGDSNACGQAFEDERAFLLFDAECSRGYPPSCYAASLKATVSYDHAVQARADGLLARGCELGFQLACASRH